MEDQPGHFYLPPPLFATSPTTSMPTHAISWISHSVKPLESSPVHGQIAPHPTHFFTHNQNSTVTSCNIPSPSQPVCTPVESAPRGQLGNLNNTLTPPSTNRYTYLPTNVSPSSSNQRRPSTPPRRATSPTVHLCHQFLTSPALCDSSCDWATGIRAICQFLAHDPPDFRSTWRDFIKGRGTI